MKKVIALLILLSAFVTLSIKSSAQEYSWYVSRNSENKQPQLDEKIRFIEKHNGYYVNKKYSDDSSEKVIYLTFDAGYSNENLESILTTLKEENVKAAFFILSNLIIKSPDSVKRMADDGHFVCNHTSKHINISKVKSSEELKIELEKPEKLYYELTGKQMQRFFRPPEGRFSEESLKYLDELGYKTVFWSFAYADWDNENQPSHSFAKKKIFENIHNGEIMLLHPTSKTNAEILKDVIIELKARGFRFGTLDEL